MQLFKGCISLYHSIEMYIRTSYKLCEDNRILLFELENTSCVFYYSFVYSSHFLNKLLNKTSSLFGHFLVFFHRNRANARYYAVYSITRIVSLRDKTTTTRRDKTRGLPFAMECDVIKGVLGEDEM